MDDTGANVLSRAGNVAVVQLSGRVFPGIHIQGDTLAALRTQLADVVRTLRRDGSNVDALDDLDAAIEEVSTMLAYYEQVLSERGIRRPY